MKGIAWMRRWGRMMTLRGLFLMLGIVAVALLVWFGGPLIAVAGWTPLASPAARFVVLLLLVVGLLARNIWQARRQRLNNEKVVNEMMAGSDKDDLLKEEVNTQRERLREALSLVKKWKPGGFGSVYQLPWYMIIGAPGSGKSTALLNSGLEFPLKEEMGIDSIKGVGGTRYCDWWFTNRAVIIDTAGRYTTQESPDKRDARGWNSFLGLLKKYRPRQPINGVIISVSVADLLEQTPTEQRLHARALKQRVQELKNRLGVVFPVYVVLTKFDLLEGFADTFSMLSEQEREEVFGATFELEAVSDPKALPGAFEAEFGALLERLSRFLLHRLQQERSPATRRRIYQFPKQAALLQAPLWNLIKEVFFPSAYEDVPLLRGIYLVSSEQGSPAYDKVSDLVDDQFKLKAPRKTAAAAPTRDGFFLRQLFENIIFSEHGLATTEVSKEKRFVWARRTAFAAMAFATVGMGTAWYLGYQWNAGLIAEYAQDSSELRAELDQPRQDWIRLDMLLSRASSMPGVFESELPEGGPRQLGLYQGELLSGAAEGTYARLLQHHFGEALKDTLEAEIDGNLGNLEYLYETLKTYLMLNQQARRNKDQIYAWFNFILGRQLPGELNAEVRDSLLGHLNHYLATKQVLTLDNELIARARHELTAMPLAERAYQRIKLDASHSRLPDFRLPMVLGSVAERVFERRSGTSLREGIPGLYTFNGYKGIFEPEKDKLVGRLLEDSWVYGEAAHDFVDLDEEQIEAGVEDRYFRDYVYHWKGFLEDLRIKRFSSQREAMQIAGLIAGPEAPIARLQAAVEFNTTLTPPEPPQNKALDAAADSATAAVERHVEFGALMGMATARNEPEPTLVDRTFKALSQLEEATLQSLQADARVIARYFEEQSGGRASALATVSRTQFDDAVRGFYSNVSQTDSDILGQILGGFVGDARRLVKVSVTKKLNDIWRSTVYADYREAIAGNYPFSPESATDVALQDFANFFGYGGILENFFREHLQAHVDTNRSPWRLTSNVGISQSSLRLFEAARQIREAFFAPGSRRPQVSFTLKPTYLDSRVTQVLLEVDDQSLIYRHGPARPVSFHWPDESGSRLTRVAVTPASDSANPVQKTYHGPWSLFRMLDAAGSMSSGARQQYVEISLDKYLASLELETDSVKHPFNMAMLEGFRLSPKL